VIIEKPVNMERRIEKTVDVVKEKEILMERVTEVKS